MPVRSIRHKGLRRLFEKGDGRGLPAASIDKLRDMLLAIQVAREIDDLSVMPGWRLEPHCHWQLALDVQIRGWRRI
jgi:toxin HigB-1